MQNLLKKFAAGVALSSRQTLACLTNPLKPIVNINNVQNVVVWVKRLVTQFWAVVPLVEPALNVVAFWPSRYLDKLIYMKSRNCNSFNDSHHSVRIQNQYYCKLADFKKDYHQYAHRGGKTSLFHQGYSHQWSSRGKNVEPRQILRLRGKNSKLSVNYFK
jgi:hypothetical protein